MSTTKTTHTPLPWKVRKNPNLGCFIEARIPGKPYGQEIMGDDYFPELSREADAEFIVKSVTEAAMLRAALTDARNALENAQRATSLDLRADIVKANAALESSTK